jgi:hypothetical protein
MRIEQLPPHLGYKKISTRHIDDVRKKCAKMAVSQWESTPLVNKPRTKHCGGFQMHAEQSRIPNEQPLSAFEMKMIIRLVLGLKNNSRTNMKLKSV